MIIVLFSKGDPRSEHMVHFASYQTKLSSEQCYYTTPQNLEILNCSAKLCPCYSTLCNKCDECSQRIDRNECSQLCIKLRFCFGSIQLEFGIDWGL